MVGNIGSTLTRVIDYVADLRPIAAVSTILGHDPAREGWGFGEPSAWWRGGGTPPPGQGGLPPGHGGMPPGHGGTPPGQAKSPVEAGEQARDPKGPTGPASPPQDAAGQPPPKTAPNPATDTPPRPGQNGQSPVTGDANAGRPMPGDPVRGGPGGGKDGVPGVADDGGLGAQPGGRPDKARGGDTAIDHEPLTDLGQPLGKGIKDLARGGEVRVRDANLALPETARAGDPLAGRNPASRGEGIDPNDPGVVRLVDRARYAGGIDQGKALHDLDRMTGWRDTTNAMVRGDLRSDLRADAARLQGLMSEAAMLRALFGGDMPKAGHVMSGMLADGLLAATLAKVAGLDAQLIRDAIRPNERTQSYDVTLFNARGAASVIAISPEELRQHAQKLGPVASERLARGEASWPLVMEAALAKSGDMGVSQALRGGREPLVHPWQWDGRTQRQTKKPGDSDRGDQRHKGSGDAKRQMLKMMAERMAKKLDTGKELKAAPRRKADGVVTQALTVREGLDEQASADGYVVQGMWQDSNGDWQVRLRNPWSTTRLVGASPDMPIADITVPLSALTARGAFEFVEG